MFVPVSVGKRKTVEIGQGQIVECYDFHREVEKKTPRADDSRELFHNKEARSSQPAGDFDVDRGSYELTRHPLDKEISVGVNDVLGTRNASYCPKSPL